MDDARSTYLATQVLTASPQRLRLMLIEGALRFGRQAQEALDQSRGDEFSNRIERARNVVGELLANIKPEKHPLNETARALYGFTFRALIEAQLQHSGERLQDALRVLEEERITWEQVCELQSSAPTAQSLDYQPSESVSNSTGSPGFSLDA